MKSKRNISWKIPVFALLFAVLAVISIGCASADTIYVPEGGNQTIQQAVNNATEGDTIIVRDAYTGTKENIDVTVAYLTIQSENGSASCIVNASNSDDHVFDVQQNYVNITGFTVENATGNWKAGIYLNGREHCNISGNNASNNDRGIFLESSSNNTLTDNTASNNDYGIHLYKSSNNTFTENTANSNNYYGILMESSCNYNTLTENTANSNSRHGIYLHYSSSNTLTDNTANSNSRHGIRLSSSSSNTLTNNTANSNDLYGIYLLHSSSNNNVSCNWVQNNSVNGFRLYDGSTGNTIENNNIIMNGELQGDGSYHYQFYNNQVNEVDAKNNYWGPGLNDTQIDASIYDWQDDPSRGNVTYLPRLGQPAPCTPTPEPHVFTTADAAIALQIAVGSRPYGSRWDVSGDGQVTSLDALMILQMAA
ncbi:MAG: hypothetical protein AEth_01438 [Candidatus Argoarchaeum ethanivorans]|uniref:Carbohydrate-binding/sugar hydrolysis domain-containing protein n=1 Tax=Candidatus Argoarchaeum ethanivorans TaxID=2608793 RepID=A0A8B3S1H6_9EURY|nr:MAG: hypothetical protein AEth_01438 [Candidatus Argoarchaeum ethanivorans]